MKHFIKFIWGSSRKIKGHWYLGLVGIYDRQGQRGNGIAISVRGLLLWGTGLGMVLYVAAAAALFSIWQNNPHSLLTFSDALLYPVRRKAIAAKQGQAFIAQGTDLFRAQKYHDAANLLRLGLARFPNDLGARLKLAQYYDLLNRRDLAVRTLTEGLTNEFPGRVYLEALFNTAEQNDDYDLIVKTGQRYLPVLRSASDRRHRIWVLSRQCAALFAAGRAQDVLPLIDAEPVDDFANEQRVLALLALHRSEEALNLVKAWRLQPGADVMTVTRFDVRALREAGRLDEMAVAIQRLRALAPGDPAGALYGIVQQCLAGKTASAGTSFDDYLFRFGGNFESLTRAAEAMADISELPLLQRAYLAAKEQGYPIHRFAALLAQTLTKSGDWVGANRILATLPIPTGRDAAQAKIWREWMQLLVEAASNPPGTTGPALVELLRSRRWTPSVYRLSAEALERGGRLELASEIVAQGLGAFPNNAWLQNEKLAIDTATRKALASDAPTAPTTAPWLSIEHQFSTRLEEAVQLADWDRAARMIRELRALRPVPSWLEKQEPTLALTQVRISHGQGNTIGVITAAEAYLNGTDERASVLLGVAQAIAREGDLRSAIAIAREITRRSPDHKPTQRALAEWRPPAKEKDPATEKQPKTKKPASAVGTIPR